MASSANLEERFNAAVQNIQNLPADGKICRLLVFG
jgi:hypothetical protein